MTEKGKGRKRISEHIEVIVDEAKSAAADAIHQSESIGESLKQTLQGALSARENVVMVRLNKESLGRLDELVDAGVVGSRSEAAAFLIGEGIKARAPLFERMSAKVEEIRRVKEELQELLNEPSDEGSDKE